MLESLNESKKLLPERVAEQIISLIADRALKAGISCRMNLIWHSSYPWEEVP